MRLRITGLHFVFGASELHEFAGLRAFDAAICVSGGEAYLCIGVFLPLDLYLPCVCVDPGALVSTCSAGVSDLTHAVYLCIL
jgi:hypothetical protein